MAKNKKTIKVNSIIKVLTGNFKNKTAKVKKIKGNFVLLEGINYKFNLGTSEDGNSKVLTPKEIPIHFSNISLI